MNDDYESDCDDDCEADCEVEAVELPIDSGAFASATFLALTVAAFGVGFIYGLCG